MDDWMTNAPPMAGRSRRWGWTRLGQCLGVPVGFPPGWPPGLFPPAFEPEWSFELPCSEVAGPAAVCAAATAASMSAIALSTIAWIAPSSVVRWATLDGAIQAIVDKAIA